jgi:predicted nucleotidyltransferase
MTTPQHHPHDTEAALERQIDNALAKDSAVVRMLKAAWPDLLAVYAFGSRIKSTANPGSDLDLAVLVPAYAPPLQLWELASQLAEVVGCPVDLLDLRAASTVMQYQVLTQGTRLFARGPGVGLFECFVLSEKTALDAARAGLLGDIARQGTVYGR